MIKYFTLAVLLFLICQSASLAQEIALQKAQDYLRTDPDSSLYYAQQALELSQRSEDHRSEVKAINHSASAYQNMGQLREAKKLHELALDKAIAYNLKLQQFQQLSNIGNTYYLLTELDSALQYHQRAIDMADSFSVDSASLANAYLLLANTYFGKQNLQDAMKHYLSCVKLYEAMGDGHGTARVYNNLGVVNIYLDDFEKAITYLERSLEYKIRLNDEKGISKAYNNLGQLYYVNKQDTSTALDYYEKSAAIKRKIKDLIGLATTLVNIGDIHWAQKDFRTSEGLYQQALNIYDSSEYDLGKIGLYYRLGQQYEKLKEYSRAIEYYDQAQDLAETKGAARDLLDIYNATSGMYADLQNFEKAFQQIDKYHVLKDSLYKLEQAKAYEEMQTKYETEKKETEIDLLNKDKELQASILRTSQTLQYSFLGGLLIVSLLMVFVYRSYQIKKRSEEEKEILLKEIHHRVKNNLQIVESLLNLQSTASGEQTAEAVLKVCRARIHAISVVHEKLYNSEDFKAIDVDNYIRELMSHIQDSYQIDGVKITSQVENVKMDLDELIPCGLILNEVITNSVKHAFAPGESGEIAINGFKNQNKYCLEVADNGKGFDTEKSKQSGSLGMKLIDALTSQLGGEFSFKIDHGVKFRLTFAL